MVKKILAHILLITFVFQIGYSMSIGNALHRIIYEFSSFYNNENEISFFDFVFKDVMCETQQSEEQSQKNFSKDIYSKSELSNTFSFDFEVEQKLYIALSSLFTSGFYFSILQPPD